MKGSFYTQRSLTVNVQLENLTFANAGVVNAWIRLCGEMFRCNAAVEQCRKELTCSTSSNGKFGDIYNQLRVC